MWRMRLHQQNRCRACFSTPTPRPRAEARPTGRTSAFTMVELLTVLIIITLLVAILIPMANRIRLSAFDASTKSEIEQISSACQRYYDVFNAYPGPVSNQDIESQSYPAAGGTTINTTSPLSSGNAVVI